MRIEAGEAVDRIRLLGGSRVEAKAYEVEKVVHRIIAAHEVDRESFYGEFGEALGGLIASMRLDLGIEQLSPSVSGPPPPLGAAEGSKAK